MKLKRPALLKALHLRAFLDKHFDGNSHSRTCLGRGEGVLIQPSLVNSAKPTFTKQCARVEILCGRFQLFKTENLQVWPFVNQAIRGRKMRRKRKRPFPAVDAFTRNIRKLTLSGATTRGCGEPHALAVYSR